MKKNIWFLLAAVVSLQGAVFAMESNEKAESAVESSSEVASSQERNQENQGTDSTASVE